MNRGLLITFAAALISIAPAQLVEPTPTASPRAQESTNAKQAPPEQNKTDNTKSALEEFDERLSRQNPIMIVIYPDAEPDSERGGVMLAFSEMKFTVLRPKNLIAEFCDALKKHRIDKEPSEISGHEYIISFVFEGDKTIMSARLLHRKKEGWFFIFENRGDGSNHIRDIFSVNPEMVAIMEKDFIRIWDDSMLEKK